MLTYHRDIRLPDGFVLPTRQVDLSWTRHALSASKSDRYGDMEVYPVLDLSICETIEVSLEGRKVVKLVLRAPYDSTLDAVFVVIPNGRNPWVVKTVWFNERNDSHKTLDRSRYAQ